MVAKKKADDEQTPSMTWEHGIARKQQAMEYEYRQFSQEHTRAMLALEAVKLNVISCEEAGAVVRAFIAGPEAEDAS